MSVADTVKRIICKQGRTQAWVIRKMNALDPELNMDRSKFSSITTGRRKMSGDELIAFCKAVEVSLDEFELREYKPRLPEKEVV